MGQDSGSSRNDLRPGSHTVRAQFSGGPLLGSGRGVYESAGSPISTVARPSSAAGLLLPSHHGAMRVSALGHRFWGTLPQRIDLSSPLSRFERQGAGLYTDFF